MWGNTTVLDDWSDSEYTVAVKARNQADVETGFGPSNSITTLPDVPACLLLGDIDQDGSVAGPDIAGYVRAKLGAAPAPGEDQDCADFGNGDLGLDTADFVTALLSG